LTVIELTEEIEKSPVTGDCRRALHEPEGITPGYTTVILEHTGADGGECLFGDLD
jgi:hypothetical protein